MQLPRFIAGLIFVKLDQLDRTIADFCEAIKNLIKGFVVFLQNLEACNKAGIGFSEFREIAVILEMVMTV